MTHADTPMPGEDPGALIEDPPRDDDLDPATEEEVPGAPRPGPAREEAPDRQAGARPPLTAAGAAG